MNTPNTHTQLSENLIVVDREWLENEIERTKSGIYDAHLVLKSIWDKSYTLTTILMDAFIDGNIVRKDIDVNKALAEYILLTITLKK